VRLPKRILAARIRADLAERRIKRRQLAAWTERSLMTVQRWVSDAPETEAYRPLRGDAILLAYLTGYPVSRYTGDPADDERFPLPPALSPVTADPHARRSRDAAKTSNQADSSPSDRPTADSDSTSGQTASQTGWDAAHQT